MINRIACPGARRPIFEKRGSGILFSAGKKAAQALKGPALQVIRQAAQKLAQVAKAKAMKAITDKKREVKRKKKVSEKKRPPKNQRVQKLLNAANLIWEQ